MASHVGVFELLGAEPASFWSPLAAGCSGEAAAAGTAFTGSVVLHVVWLSAVAITMSKGSDEMLMI